MAWINLLETIYPVGSVYISTLQTSPSSAIGGTWTQITDAVLRGSNSTGYTGSDTHTLTVNEMPTHRHTQNTPYYALNSGGSTGHTTYWGPYGTDTALPVTTFTGGARAFNHATFLQPLYLVQNSISFVSGVVDNG